MKEQNLIELGFERNDDNDGDNDYYYYTLELGNDYSPLCLISNGNDEAGDNDWSVSIFDYESIIFTELKQLKELINLLKNNIK